MIEKVARALARHDNPKHENWWPSYDTRARAAIAAMRINTPEMCKAGREAIEGAEDVISCGPVVDYRSVACWRAMIDAALKEQP